VTIFQAIILSVIEGLTEFLPISSTGHLILAQKYLSITTSEFTKSFDIIIQFAAILAVVWIFRHRLFKSSKIWKPAIIAFIPTGIIGFTLYKLIRNILLGNPLIVVYSLFFGGLILLLVDRISKLNHGLKTQNDLSTPQLLGIGLFQSLSIIPGVSRSAAAIVGGLSFGLTRAQAVEFSFFMAIPTMLAASGYDLLKSGMGFSPEEYLLLALGCLISFLSALVAVRLFIDYVKKHDFTLFAVYRILLSTVAFFTISS